MQYKMSWWFDRYLISMNVDARAIFFRKTSNEHHRLKIPFFLQKSTGFSNNLVCHFGFGLCLSEASIMTNFNIFWRLKAINGLT